MTNKYSVSVNGSTPGPQPEPALRAGRCYSSVTSLAISAAACLASANSIEVLGS
jgi:hypothetical protein